MYDEGGEEVFLGRTAAQPSKAMSDETALSIDKEVRAIIDECYEKARNLLEEHRSTMDMMADALMQYETIDSEQIDAIMEGRKPNPPSDWSDGPSDYNLSAAHNWIVARAVGRNARTTARGQRATHASSNIF